MTETRNRSLRHSLESSASIHEPVIPPVPTDRPELTDPGMTFEVMRLYRTGLTVEQIARTVQVPESEAAEHVRLALAAGITNDLGPE